MVCFVLIVWSRYIAAAENTAIQGLVVSANDQTAIPYALVSIKGAGDVHTRADEDGEFVLKVSGPGTYTIKASINGDLVGESQAVIVDTRKPEDRISLQVVLSAQAPGLVVIARAPLDQASAIRISKQELTRIAGTSGEPLLAIQSLPGVAVGADGSADPAIRGSFPGDNLYYVDFLPIGYLLHLSDTISVFPGNFIKEIDFYPSAFGPEFGDKIGAVFDISFIDPDTNQWRRTLDISLLGFNANMHGPIADNHAVYLGFRRGFLDIAAKVSDFEERNNQRLIDEPTYIDFQGKYVWHANPNNKFSLTVLGANDSAATASNPPEYAWLENNDFGWKSVATTWDLSWGKLKNKLSLGYLHTNEEETNGPVYEQKIQRDAVYVKNKLRYRMNDKHDLLMGGELSSLQLYDLEQYNYYCGDEGPCRATPEIDARINRGAAYLKDRWRLWKTGFADIGVRLSGNDLVKQFYLEPRLGVNWHITPKASVSAAWGRYNQIPNVKYILGSLPSPNLRHLRSKHSSLGLTYQFSQGWSSKTELFYKWTWGHVGCSPVRGNCINSGSSEAYGLEWMIKKALTDRFSGWLSFTASRAQYINEETDYKFPTHHDQPIIASLVVSYKIATDWFFDSKFYYRSGRPYTPIDDVIPVVDEETGEIAFYQPTLGDNLSARYPAAQRLDIRLSKKWKFSSWDLDAYVGAINLLDRDNVSEYSYSFDYSEKYPGFELPRIITLGITATF